MRPGSVKRLVPKAPLHYHSVVIVYSGSDSLNCVTGLSAAKCDNVWARAIAVLSCAYGSFPFYLLRKDRVDGGYVRMEVSGSI